MNLSTSQNLTLGYAALVGVGGIMGYIKRRSFMSLGAGGVSSAVLFYVYTELPKRPNFASSIGLGVSATLLAAMGVRFYKTKKMFPAGAVVFLSLAMSGGYLHGVLQSNK